MLTQLRTSNASERLSSSRLEKQIRRKTSQAIADFDLVEQGDLIMVCISGGKDSYALLDVMLDLQKRSPVKFSLIAVNIDQGWPGYDTKTIDGHLATRDVDYKMVTEDFAETVERNLKPGATPCSLCSRLRRGVLYSIANSLGVSKIALGHHRDDLLETLMLNLFYSGQLSTMPAKLISDDQKNVVIRPLAYVPEDSLVRWAKLQKYPVVRCGCPSCGLPEQRRQWMKRLLADLEQENPDLKNHMLRALRNVKPTHLLDPSIHRRTTDDVPPQK